MPVSVQWDDQAPDILVWTFEGRYTWAEYERASDDMTHMTAGAFGTVDMIYDVSQASLHPADLVGYLRRRLGARPAPYRRGAVVGANHYLQLIWTTLTALALPHMALTFYATLDEARAGLHAQDGDGSHGD